MLLAGVCSNSCTDLNINAIGIPTTHRYCDKTLQHIVRKFAGVVGDEFLMQDCYNSFSWCPFLHMIIILPYAHSIND